MSEFGSTVDNDVRKEFRKTQYLMLKPGKYTIRILDEVETKVYGHWFMGRGWLECLGDECPVCQNNKKILFEHPEDYRDVDGWNPRRARFFLNVFDKADNTVKVLGSGPQLIEDLKVMSQSVRTEQDERVDHRMYDWELTVRGEGRDKEVTPAYRYFGKETKIDYNPEDKFDLSNCMIKVSAEEMLDVFNGASLKDVFAMRKAKKQSQADAVISDISADIQDAVDEVFKS